MDRLYAGALVNCTIPWAGCVEEFKATVQESYRGDSVIVRSWGSEDRRIVLKSQCQLIVAAEERPFVERA